MNIVCRPIGTWPGQLRAEHERRQAQFSASWSDTVSLLEREADKLGAREVVLQLAVAERDLRLDGWIRADAKPSHPGAIISIESRHGPLRYSTDLFSGTSYSVRTGQPGSYRWRTEYVPGWQCNVRAIALGLEALRKVDRYGIGQGGEQYRGWQALPPGTPMPAASMTIEDAARLLCDATAETIGEDPTRVDRVAAVASSLWREAVKAHHPDVGGDPERFRLLTDARDLLVSWWNTV